jgi:hypothetical protein
MKFIFTLSLLIIALGISAQWSTTNNLFADSLHMQVTTADKTQSAPLVVRSYPDSGYFVIWQDYRNSPTNSKCNIYAQKYDKAGTPLWATNGVPISLSPNQQRYTYQGQYYGNHSYAATDSAGGFYIGYSDDSTTNYLYERACVQHIRSDGSAVFPGPGYIVYSSTSGNFRMSVQLIADGNGGFFFSYLAPSVVGTPSRAYVYCFKDINGSLQSFGGGQVNENAVQQFNTSPCGNYTTVAYPDANVDDYHIFSDMQGGCNIVMDLTGTGTQGVMLGYNRLWRAKTNATATQYIRGDDYNGMPVVDNYQQGNVYRLYYLKTDHQQISCGGGSTFFTVTQYRLIQLGFQLVNGGSSIYDINYAKGVTVSTAGNINATFVAASERGYSPSTGVSDGYVRAYTIKEAVYDSIPYQRASSLNPDYPGYNTDEPASIDKLTFWRDTILAGNGGGYFDFALEGGSNQIYSAGLIEEDNLSLGYRNLRLQHFAVEPAGADSFAIVYKTALKQGVIIGQDQQNFYYTAQYGIPRFAVNQQGNALFYIKENRGSTGPIRVSPVLNGAKLAWGAMGRAIGTGVWSTSYYNTSLPFLSLDPVNGTALMSWVDTRNASTTGENIYMFHLNNLNDPTYQPPYKRLRPVSSPYGTLNAGAPLFGSSNTFTAFEVYNPYGTDPGTSPVVEISDNYNLGNVDVRVYQHNGNIRTSNGKPYLDRSYVITPEHNPNGAATITIRLFFTTAEFDKLKAADPTITNPGHLAVVKQPTGTSTTYTIVAGEETIAPKSWAAVTGGYYIEIQVTSFSNFFILKNENAGLPVTWLGIQAQWLNAGKAKVSWQVGDQLDVDRYIVQHSLNGFDFTDVCTVNASTQTQYSCVMAAGNGRHYYRVMEIDIDGRRTFSKTVLLQDVNLKQFTLYPNPAKDVLYISGTMTGFTIQVIDMSGRIIQRQTLAPGSQSIDISHLMKGNYLLQIISGSETQTLKFNKE